MCTAHALFFNISRFRRVCFSLWHRAGAPCFTASLRTFILMVSPLQWLGSTANLRTAVVWCPRPEQSVTAHGGKRGFALPRRGSLHASCRQGVINLTGRRCFCRGEHVAVARASAPKTRKRNAQLLCEPAATTGTLALDFTTGDLALSTAGAAGNPVYASSATNGIAVHSTPARIVAAAARHASAHGVFQLAACNVLQCVWPSAGIVLAGAQGTSAGASVVLESKNLWWNASTTGVGGCQVGAAAVRALDVVGRWRSTGASGCVPRARPCPGPTGERPLRCAACAGQRPWKEALVQPRCVVARACFSRGRSTA